jgi:nucleoside-diphosphate-sugar epimerase
MKIGILGGRGFIGSKIVEQLSSEHSFFIVKREIFGNFADLVDFKPEFIINAAASLPSAAEIDSRIANFDYPLSVFAYISENLLNAFTWIQLASYYELEPKMLKSNWYTRHKSEFRSSLRTLCADKNIDFRTIFLPHVIGVGERSGRLVSSAAKSIYNNSEFKLNFPHVKLPILVLDDAVRAVNQFLKTDQKVASAIPIWYKSNKELLQEISEIIASGFEVEKRIKNQQTDSKSIDFPTKVEGWEPRITLREYISSLEY